MEKNKVGGLTLPDSKTLKLSLYEVFVKSRQGVIGRRTDTCIDGTQHSLQKRWNCRVFIAVNHFPAEEIPNNPNYLFYLEFQVFSVPSALASDKL